MKGWILGAMLGLAVPVQAQSYSILGVGGRSCSEWLAADAKGPMKLSMLSWLGGYVTAAHINLESDPKLFEELVTTYCKQHPSDRLEQAAAFFVQLITTPLDITKDTPD